MLSKSLLPENEIFYSIYNWRKSVHADFRLAAADVINGFTFQHNNTKFLSAYQHQGILEMHSESYVININKLVLASLRSSLVVTAVAVGA